MVTDVLTRLWKDRCCVTIRTSYKRPNNSTAFREQILFQDEPCKLSFYPKVIQSNSPTKPNEIAAPTNQLVKLFLSPDKEIPPGSKISVLHNGKVTEYTHSGQPARMTNHQEILLEVFEKWA